MVWVKRICVGVSLIYLCLLAIGNLAEAEEEEQKPKQGTRAYFKDSSSCYIMDAKSMGNIGRYLNVSQSSKFVLSRLRTFFKIFFSCCYQSM